MKDEYSVPGIGRPCRWGRCEAPMVSWHAAVRWTTLGCERHGHLLLPYKHERDENTLWASIILEEDQMPQRELDSQGVVKLKVMQQKRCKSHHLIVTLAVRDTMAVLFIKVKTVLHEELDWLGLYDVLLWTQQGEVIHLDKVSVCSLKRKKNRRKIMCSDCEVAHANKKKHVCML